MISGSVHDVWKLLIGSLSPCENSTEGIENGIDEAEEGGKSPFDDHSAAIVDDTITSDVVTIIGPGSCSIIGFDDPEDEEVDGANYRPNHILNYFCLKRQTIL